MISFRPIQLMLTTFMKPKSHQEAVKSTTTNLFPAWSICCWNWLSSSITITFPLVEEAIFLWSRFYEYPVTLMNYNWLLLRKQKPKDALRKTANFPSPTQITTRKAANKSRFSSLYKKEPAASKWVSSRFRLLLHVGNINSKQITRLCRVTGKRWPDR